MRRSLLLSGIAVTLAVLTLSETAIPAHDQAEWRFFVAGEVKKPGKFDRGEQLTLMQAIALAEGVTFKAEPKRLIIFRYDQTTDKRVEIKVDLEAVAKGQIADIPLMFDDIIVVPNKRQK